MFYVVCAYLGDGVVGEPLAIYRKKDKHNMDVDYRNPTDYNGDTLPVRGDFTYVELSVQD